MGLFLAAAAASRFSFFTPPQAPDPARRFSGRRGHHRGMRVYPTPALGAGTAVVAQADQIVVAVRSDASVEFSRDARFEYDATLARVIARIDGGIADARGLCSIGVT
jgi:Phage capsid family